MIRSEGYDAGKGWQTVAIPTWTMRTIYYWNQVFPAKSVISVSHSYKPSVGAAVETVVGSEYANAESMREYLERYCVDDDFIRAVRRLRRPSSKRGRLMLTEQRLEYILTTGANWAGTIRDFTMTIDKGAADNLVSFCGTGVRKISPTKFQVTMKDFYPEKNVDVLILKPVRQP